MNLLPEILAVSTAYFKDHRLEQKPTQTSGLLRREYQHCGVTVLEMDSTWKEEAREAKNNLTENCDLGTENGEPNLGRGTTCCTG
ncbi:hypothetical protein AAFF_G00032470 [Aldrovandia affinis]|uniref:Uncharacterized protein n=1 Tax=Aldrovandia affinis TaxID=143900 RepID=A0AAD7S411_9TELE|nr:hypothetical protein AAFF_G00032470 [Aldrovandia affinis]